MQKTKKLRLAYKGQSLPAKIVASPIEQAKLDSINLQRSTLSALVSRVSNPDLADDVALNSVNLISPAPSVHASEDYEGLLKSVEDDLASLNSVNLAAAGPSQPPPSAAHSANVTAIAPTSSSDDVKYSSAEECCKMVHIGFAQNDLEMVRRAVASVGLEAAAVHYVQTNAWNNYLLTELIHSQYRVSELTGLFQLIGTRRPL